MMRSTNRPRLALVSAVALVAGLSGSTALATHPGSNGRLVFERANRDFSNVDLHTVRPDGSGPARLTRLRGIEGDAEWSPDGTKVVFVRARRFGPVPFEVWVMNADGSGLRQLTRHRTLSIGPTWSPDGSKIAYVSERGPNTHLFVMNADGSRKRRLVGGRRSVSDPAYSPDGRAIVLSLFRGGERPREQDFSLAVVGANGRGLRQLTRRGGADEVNPNWSPDGTRIVYERNALFSERQSDIAVINADGSAQRRITRTRVFEIQPVWSPDGTRIAFAGDRDNRSLSRERQGRGFEVYTMATNGSDVRRLTRNRVTDVTPSWQPLP